MAVSDPEDIEEKKEVRKREINHGLAGISQDSILLSHSNTDMIESINSKKENCEAFEELRMRWKMMREKGKEANLEWRCHCKLE